MNNDYRIEISSEKKGKSIVISPRGKYRLTEDGLRGFGAAAMEVKIGSSAMYNGGFATSRRYLSRELELTFELADSAEMNEARREIISLCDPSDELSITALLYGEERRITAIPCGEPEMNAPTPYHPLTVTLYFIAPCVFFSAVRERETVFADAAPMLAFPLNLMANCGTVSGIYRITDTAEVCAEGDAECGFVLTITARGGSVVNPSVTLEVGEEEHYIDVTATLADGESAVIDTTPGRKSLTVRGVKSYAFDSESEFFSLPLETARLTLDAEEGAEYIAAVLRFTPLYSGM